MTQNAEMKPLLRALNDRKESGAPVQFWLRDDDAVEPTKSLENLLDLTERFAIPLTLAVIPAHSTDSLAELLVANHRVAVAVHGWSHQNYAPDGEKKQELGLHRALPEILSELARGYILLAQRHASNFVPLLVPPWNRIDSAIVQELPELGFLGLSTFGADSSVAISMVNTQVDVIDWKGTRGGRAANELVHELVELIDNTRTPIGILTHHLVHDGTAWEFLEQLFFATSAHTGADWVPVNDLLPAISSDASPPQP